MSFEFIDTASAALAASSSTGLPLTPAAPSDLMGSEPDLVVPPTDTTGAAMASAENEIDFGEDADLRALFLSGDEANPTAESRTPQSTSDGPAPIVADAPSTSGTDTIVVTGTRHKEEGSASGGEDFDQYYRGGFWYSYNPGGDSGAGGGGDEVAAPSDEATVEVTPNFEPTPEQKAVLDRFEEALEQALNAIKALPDDAKITLKDGSTVSGAQLKQAISKLDFVINPKDFLYDNGTKQGEARWDNGNPQISFNIDLVEGYDAHPGNSGLHYVILHDIGHITASNMNLNLSAAERERMANDTAWAIAASAGLSFVPTTGTSAPDGGFSTLQPMTFESPSGGGGGGGIGEHPSY